MRANNERGKSDFEYFQRHNFAFFDPNGIDISEGSKNIHHQPMFSVLLEHRFSTFFLPCGTPNIKFELIVLLAYFLVPGQYSNNCAPSGCP